MAKSIFETWRRKRKLTGKEAGKVWLYDFSNWVLEANDRPTEKEVLTAQEKSDLISKIKNDEEHAIFKEYVEIVRQYYTFFYWLDFQKEKIESEILAINLLLSIGDSNDSKIIMEQSKKAVLDSIGDDKTRTTLDAATHDKLIAERINQGIDTINTSLIEIYSFNFTISTISKKLYVPLFSTCCIDTTKIEAEQLAPMNERIANLRDNASTGDFKQLQQARLDLKKRPKGAIKQCYAAFKLGNKFSRNIIYFQNVVKEMFSL